LVPESVVLAVQKYLQILLEQNIPVTFGVVFGSQVHDEAGQWSDIDLLVVSPCYGEKREGRHQFSLGGCRAHR